jgi:hypothetical protein
LILSNAEVDGRFGHDGICPGRDGEPVSEEDHSSIGGLINHDMRYLFVEGAALRSKCDLSHGSSVSCTEPLLSSRLPAELPFNDRQR